MCFVGHISDHLESYSMDERLLVLIKEDMLEDMFKNISKLPSDNLLGGLEGCYLYFDTKKKKWIMSGKTSGDGLAACFRGRGNKHADNAQSRDQMRKNPLYQLYPVKGVKNIVGEGGYFGNLDMYCGMAFDKKEDVAPLCSDGADNSVFVWSKQSINELKKKGDNLQKVQLDAVAYLWEICYDLALAKFENVSVSPGFESLGLRGN